MTDSDRSNPEFDIVVPKPHGDLSRATVRFVDSDGNIKETLNAAPIEELEALVQEWEETPKKDHFQRYLARKKCAQELQEAINKYD